MRIVDDSYGTAAMGSLRARRSLVPVRQPIAACPPSLIGVRAGGFVNPNKESDVKQSPIRMVRGASA